MSNEQSESSESAATTAASSPEHMSDFETLMWNLESDPWFNPSGAMITIQDRPLNQKHFRRSISQAIAAVPKLRQRVVPAPTKLTTPGWETDPEFDLDFHLPTLALPESACAWSDLMDMASWLYQQPYDRSRPLWQIISIEGLEGGRSAVVWKFHHIIGDATTMMKMAEFYMQLKRRDKLPNAVDLEALFAEEVAAQPVRSHNPIDALAETAAETIATVAKRQTGLVRKALGEVMLWGADPVRAKEFGQDTVSKATATIDQLRGSKNAGSESESSGDSGEGSEASGESDRPSGSPIWRDRSRHRTLHSLQVPLDEAKAAAKDLGGSINDFFVTGAVIGSLAYHHKRKVDLDSLNISFVVSTRKSGDSSANAFTPMRMPATATEMTAAERFAHLHDQMADKKEEAKSGSGMSSLASAANLLPGSMVSNTARAQSAGIDFATSNFRGAPLPVFISGGRLLQHVPIGPVAGTAFNLTVMSYDNSLDFGVFIDPMAVEDPAALQACLVAGYQELLDAANS